MPEFLFNGKLYYTPVEFVMDRIGGTWKMPVLWRLQTGTKRYNELKKTLPKVTHKMLTASLRELETDGFITRTVYPVVPPKVEYALTARGKEAVKVIAYLRDYGFVLMEEFGLTHPEPVKVTERTSKGTEIVKPNQVKEAGAKGKKVKPGTGNKSKPK